MSSTASSIAPTKNIDSVSRAYASLRSRSIKVPGMMLVHGPAGYGKTTSCDHLLASYGGISVRSQTFWSASGMLEALCEALGIESTSRPYRTIRVIAQHLKRNPQPVVIDEADHLFLKPQLLEGLRDIHDLTENPIVLVGMAGIDRKIQRHPQLLRRITQFAELKPLDLEDLKSISTVVCTMPVADDLLTHILNKAKGSTGLAVVGLSQVDRFCQGEKTANLKGWNTLSEPLFLGSRVA